MSEKSQFWSKCLKISILVKMFKYLDFRKISTLVNIFEYNNSGQNWRKISIFVVSKFPRKLDFGRNFLRLTILVKIWENFKFR